MEFGPLSLEAATTLAQVIPALLVAGILGPLIAGARMDRSSRRFFAFAVVSAVVAEGICLIAVLTQQGVPTVGTVIVVLGTFYSLLPVVTYPLVWARGTADEIEEHVKAKEAVAERRQTRKWARARQKAIARKSAKARKARLREARRRNRAARRRTSAGPASEQAAKPGDG